MKRFIADRMLGRLARMLRLLGYDTLYLPELAPAGLEEIARRDARIILTRGETRRRFRGPATVFSVSSEHPPEQLREVVTKFSLDPASGLWTRCTVCNRSIVPVAKQEVRDLVKPKVYEVYSEFFRCTGCERIYWRGSHVERILKNLSSILGQTS
ncbi:MAG TPA: Mut7-C RNAse domain-containing protein [Terriglobia bacterium]|nr:Mut7-C RNAse domain-containing protein [Terriglobia bacterium]